MKKKTMRLKFTVSESDNGMTVGEFLKNRCGLSRRLIISLKQVANGITKNGEHIRTVDRIGAGDIIEIADCSDTPLEPNGELFAPLVYEDEFVAIFNKPANMPAHPSHKHRSDTLGNYFAYLYPNLTFRIINRLDRDTSGLCVCAKSAYAANALQGKVEKTYYAAVCGEIFENGTVDAPIARERESIITRCVRSDGQRAVTHYDVIDRTLKHTLLKIYLETGRTHQIRVHMAYIGHPLAGDDLYGGDGSLNRQALHCGQVSFVHPITGEKITVSVPLPDDIKSLFERKKRMEKIASFQVDHRKFGVGMYISRIDGDIVTYDVRMVRPNGGHYISNPSLHTIEHLFATYARSSFMGKDVIYVGPMGCRTGFYLLVRNVQHENAIKLVKESFEFVKNFEGIIPGYSEIECGNWLEHDLESAKKDVVPLLEILENYTAEQLYYPE